MDFFQSVYLPSLDESVTNRTLHTLHSVHLDAMPAIRIIESDVLRKLKDIDSSKASGPDNIFCFIFNSCSNVLCGPLTSTQEGCFPSSWKSANIVPIHKSGNKLSVSNYKPISLLPQIAKVFEKILCEQILSSSTTLSLGLLHQPCFIIAGGIPTRESSWMLPTRIFQRPLIESTMISCYIK